MKEQQETRGALTADYDYELPPDRIAQFPAEPRDSSRMLVVDRASGRLEHRTFRDLPSFIPAGDLLVRNSSRVFRARLLGRRASGQPAEVLLLREIEPGRFEALVHPGGKLKPGRTVTVSDSLAVHIEATTDQRTRIVRVESSGPVHEAIAREGHVPLPPYIARSDAAQDADRYQTVYARETGSAAAPTAGLHFTDALLGQLAGQGVAIADVLLHVGTGTFKPVEVDDPAQHHMHEEWYSVGDDAAHAVAAARTSGGAVWAVGTTALRVLESTATDDGLIQAGSGETRLFVRPPFQFRAVQHLLTNFHLPRSTLLMLVAAFAGYDLTMRAYREAINSGYRFYSYGDAMLLI